MCRLLYMLIMLVFESLWHTNCVGVFRPLPEWKRQTAGKILLVSSATWQCWINFVHYAHQTVYENCGSPAHNFNVMCLEWLVDFNKVHKMFFFFPSCCWVVKRCFRQPVQSVLHPSFFILPVRAVLPLSRLTYLVICTHKHRGWDSLAIQAVDLSATNNFLCLLCSLFNFQSLSTFLLFLLLPLCVSLFLLACLCCLLLCFYIYLFITVEILFVFLSCLSEFQNFRIGQGFQQRVLPSFFMYHMLNLHDKITPCFG